jgi:predicted O-methyltransferase YrrM
MNLFKKNVEKPVKDSLPPFHHLDSKVLTVRNIEMLHKAMGWKTQPYLEGEHLYAFDYLPDLNDRRIRDAEVILSACANGNPQIILEIGTSQGKTTSLMAQNAPQATVYTVNIPPEEIHEGGKFVTYAPGYELIGKDFRDKGIKNIQQIYGNTAIWEPDFGPIDVAFIDGCHDAEYVYNDTKKILKKCRPGSIILWHDFNPDYINVYDWIKDVCTGVERLYREGILSNKILHLQDSWVGLYKL